MPTRGPKWVPDERETWKTKERCSQRFPLFKQLLLKVVGTPRHPLTWFWTGGLLGRTAPSGGRKQEALVREVWFGWVGLKASEGRVWGVLRGGGGLSVQGIGWLQETGCPGATGTGGTPKEGDGRRRGTGRRTRSMCLRTPDGMMKVLGVGNCPFLRKIWLLGWVRFVCG